MGDFNLHAFDGGADRLFFELRERILAHQHQVDWRITWNIGLEHVENRMRVLCAVVQILNEAIPAEAMSVVDEQIKIDRLPRLPIGIHGTTADDDER